MRLQKKWTTYIKSVTKNAPVLGLTLQNKFNYLRVTLDSNSLHAKSCKIYF